MLLAFLFNLYSEEVFFRAINGVEEGIRINGKILNNIGYADDSVIIADNEEALQLATLEGKLMKKGVRVCCFLSPIPMNLYSKAIFREALVGINGGIKVNGTNIRYTDNAVIITKKRKSYRL